jgi:pyridoxal phosphate phosphatase PHOSPHO2
VVYAGDGANDICPALTLGPSDVVLARRGYSLGNFFEGGQTPARAKVQLWQDHEELLQLIRGLVV